MLSSCLTFFCFGCAVPGRHACPAGPVVVPCLSPAPRHAARLPAGQRSLQCVPGLSTDPEQQIKILPPGPSAPNQADLEGGIDHRMKKPLSRFLLKWPCAGWKLADSLNFRPPHPRVFHLVSPGARSAGLASLIEAPKEPLNVVHRRPIKTSN